MPVAGISQGLGFGGGSSATSSGSPGGPPPAPPETFDTTVLLNGGNLTGASNVITFTLKPDAAIEATGEITLAGMTGSQTADNASLTIAGANAAVFGSSADWTKSSGTLVLTVAGGQSVPTATDTVITFTLTNKATAQSGQSVTVASSGFTTATATGAILEAAANKFNVTATNNQATILATDPSSNYTIEQGSDTYDLYVYDGGAPRDWVIYANDYTP